MAKTLYFNGSILTMDKGAPRAEALLCEGDRILAVGDPAELEKIADGAVRVDLGGKTLMPAFVDAQNVHPILQPTCVETHAEYPYLYFISTLSTRLPSPRLKRYFTVSSSFEHSFAFMPSFPER